MKTLIKNTFVLKTQTILLIISLSMVAFVSCKKEKEELTTVNGVVKDFYTQQPVEGIAVDMYNTVGSWTGISIPVPVASTTTGINGIFSIAHNGSASEIFADTYPSSKTNGYSEIQTGKKNEVILYIIQRGKCLVKIKNVSPYDNNDRLYIVGLSMPQFEFYGKEVNKEILCPAPVGEKIETEYLVTKNGSTAKYPLNVFVSSKDSIPVVEINY